MNALLAHGPTNFDLHSSAADRGRALLALLGFLWTSFDRLPADGRLAPSSAAGRPNLRGETAHVGLAIVCIAPTRNFVASIVCCARDVSEGGEKKQAVGTGPAARARAEGRSYNLRILKSAMTPLANDDGTLRGTTIAPYQPVLHACDLCPARCCRLNVKVSLPDAIHYCTTLGLPFFAGMTMVPSTHEAHAFKVEQDRRIWPDDEGWLGTAEIQLRRRADGSCHGLISIGGYERCGIYAARPSLCRLYPFSWTSDVARGHPGMILCPVPFGVTEAEEKQFLLDAQRSIDHWELHDDVVAEWHAAEPEGGVRTIEAFLSFAVPRVANILGVAYDKILARGGPPQRLYEAMLKSGIVRPPAAANPPARTPEKSG